MKKIILTICSVVVVLGICQLANAEEVSGNDASKDVSFCLTTDVFTEYIWRGARLNKEPVIQPSASVGYKSWTATLWYNIDTTSYNNREWDVYETDYLLDYSGRTFIEGIGYSVGAGRYTFQGEGNEAHHIASTTEIYLGLNADCPLNPSVKFYHDVDEVEGTYAQFSVGHSQEKFANVCGVPLGIKAGASLGWGSNSYNKYYWGVEGGNLNDLTLSLAFPLEVCGWGVTPNINYATIVDGDVRSANAYGDNHNLFAGINFCKKF